MAENNYRRGSEWRKWDLQIHTPYSYLNNQFGNNFDNYVKKVFEKALENDICAIGITDYFCIEGYKKIKNDYLNKEKLKTLGFSDEDTNRILRILILPNIEFRLNKLVGSSRINFHVIFSNDVSIQDIEENFLHELDFVYEGCPQNEDEKRKLKIINLEDLGKKLKSEHAKFKKDSNLFVGMKTAVVDDKDMMNLLSNKKTKFKEKYLIFTPVDEDLSEIDWNGQDHLVRKIIIQKSDGLFSTNENTMKWGLGEKHSSPNEFIREFKTLKPCIFGSDAHKYEELFQMYDNKFCWIKSDPTFEGLKQIVYEPEDRVKIQELKPEEKNVYEIIDKVKFIDDSFTPEDILINQKLTTIIGGKSTGKSILLRNIAKTIDPDEVLKRLKEVELDEYNEEVKDFNVLWGDDQENRKGEATGVGKKIIYIPQSYLNRLVDKKEDNTSIDIIIKNVLEQEEDIKNVFSELEIQTRDLQKSITQNIEELFYKEQDVRELTAATKEIGDKKGIESEIKKLKKEISELKKKSGMTDEEIKEYDKLISNSVKLKERKESNQKNLEILEILNDQKIFVVPVLDSLSEELRKNLEDAFFVIKEKFQSEWIDRLNNKIIEMQKTDLENDKEIAKNDKKLRPLVVKVIESRSLDEKTKKLNVEENKLKLITQQSEKLNILVTDYTKMIENIMKSHSQFFDIFFNAKSKILKQRSITEDNDLEFGIDVIFKRKHFQENCIDDICDQRKLGQFEGGFLQDYKYSSPLNLKSDIEKTFRAILGGKINIKNSYSRKEAVTKLIKPWFTFDYRIKQGGDEISEMSPGKKSFVLLKLLIELDNSECPILLDQPEDDLDNRSIYNDLAKFIKEKKKTRQMIIATHNPNLVVGADSECVIVANQSGDKSKNKTYNFEYVQGSLENTFLNEDSLYILEQRGIQEHVCDILEGGKAAFKQRKRKYNV